MKDDEQSKQFALEIDRAVTRLHICEEIMEIMKTYRHQESVNGFVDTPGGLEHMGDVWKKLARWDRMLRGEQRC